MRLAFCGPFFLTMEKVKIAIQKGGRLSEKSLDLLKQCGFEVTIGHNKLRASAPDSDLEILFLRDDDIPKYVEMGVADFGFVGLNVLEEDQREVDLVASLGFGKCRMSLAVDKHEQVDSVQFFQGKRIATSYPNILNAFLKKEGVRAEIHDISGSVEIAPGIGLADAVFDIVSTGSTLAMNGLKEVIEVMRSEAVLISNQNLNEKAQNFLKQFLFRIDAVLTAKAQRYILLNAPNDKLEAIASVLPGVNSPTVMPLLKEGWSSVHSVVPANKIWDIIDELRNLGAEGILINPIEKMFR